MTVEA